MIGGEGDAAAARNHQLRRRGGQVAARALVGEQALAAIGLGAREHPVEAPVLGDGQGETGERDAHRGGDRPQTLEQERPSQSEREFQKAIGRKSTPAFLWTRFQTC